MCWTAISIPSWPRRWRRKSAASRRKKSKIWSEGRDCGRSRRADLGSGGLQRWQGDHIGLSRLWRRLFQCRLFFVLAQGILGAAATALEEGAALHRKRFVQDVAFDMAGGAEKDLAGMDAPDDAAAHRDILGPDFAMHFRALADHQADTADIALENAVDLHVAAGVERARHGQ